MHFSFFSRNGSEVGLLLTSSRKFDDSFLNFSSSDYDVLITAAKKRKYMEKKNTTAVSTDLVRRKEWK